MEEKVENLETKKKEEGVEPRDSMGLKEISSRKGEPEKKTGENVRLT